MGGGAAGPRAAGCCPRSTSAAHRRLVDLVAGLVGTTVAGGEAVLGGVHDVSAGGLGVALAEMAARAGVGLAGDPAFVPAPGELFTELPSRAVVATARPEEVLAGARSAGVPATVLGTAGGDRLALWGAADLPLEDVRAAWSGALPSALGEPAA